MMILDRLHVSSGYDTPEPTKRASLGQILEQIDSKTAIWCIPAPPSPAYNPVAVRSISRPGGSEVIQIHPRNQRPQQQQQASNVYSWQIPIWMDGDEDGDFVGITKGGFKKKGERLRSGNRGNEKFDDQDRENVLFYI